MAVLCIGEMLIDFIGEGVGTIDKVKSFKTVLNENGTITDSYKGTFIIEW